ncbi:IS607 family element RNA-guided endonuclease TnpB [Catellatospora tritici]|uniref:IS607 family element RNA-guided endonuclease TnpB n=1 Tax=Catellatospora tritici TaxID=2851566 RepID=UPI001C2CD4D4|nr:IS607 family element RNA-guided endonuclease TnpB [Catellatospora tritici]MBV1856337.1 IS607 family element transposase accessory protein TnpB [Catellatospora tritici]
MSDVAGEVVVQAYRFALDPTPAQDRDLHRHAGAGRFAFNWALATVRTNLGQRAAERTYGLTDAQLTPAQGWTLPALRRAWNTAKPQVAPWWSQCSKEAYNTGLDGLARALGNWSASRSGRRAGPRVGFARFRSRRRVVPSVRFTTGTIRVEDTRHHVTLPRLGRIRTHESTRKLARRLHAGTARILSATVRLTSGRWHVSFTVEVTRTTRTPVHPQRTVGVDVGIANLAVLSTGQVVPNPRHLAAASERLRGAARTLSRRQGPDRRTGQQPSRRWRRAKTCLARAHARVANLRADGLHKLTTTLAATYGTVIVEDLNISGMMANRRLARHIADAGWATLHRQLQYKTAWNGGREVVADRWFASSKTCSSCGAVRLKLPLRERTYHCEHCGLILDRDLNAAINLKQYVVRSGRETLNGRGADHKTILVVAGGREATTPHHHPGGQDGDRRPATADCNTSTH